MRVTRVSNGVYRVWYSGIEGLAITKGKGVELSPGLRGRGMGMRALNHLIAEADRLAAR